MAKPIRSKMNLGVLNVDFDSDAECRTALEELRFPHGVYCLRCQSTKISRISTRKQFDCDACRYRFSVTTGTIFHDSHLPLPKWFLAILLMCEAKKGISANQMKRTLGVAHKTAWYLCHRIREAMRELNPEPLDGTVEMDETYIGGKWRGKDNGKGDGREDWRDHKAMVLGVIERGGDIRMSTGETPTAEVLKAFAKKFVSPTVDRIYTDEYRGYARITDNHNAIHESVDHSKKEYVRGNVHTNNIESAFGLFKRGVIGSFHQISRKHLDRYLDEFEFRYNNRKNSYLFRDTLTRLVTTEAMPYEKLTA